MQRGADESASIFLKTFDKQVTIQAVPTPAPLASTSSSAAQAPPRALLYGDSENEFTFIPDDIPFKHQRDSRGFDNDGSDATKWGLDIAHLDNLIETPLN